MENRTRRQGAAFAEEIKRSATTKGLSSPPEGASALQNMLSVAKSVLVLVCEREIINVNVLFKCTAVR